MINVFDTFNPEKIFSAKNPFLQTAQKTHQLAANAFDKSARLNLALAEDLLELNRKRIDALYSGESVQEAMATQQDLLADFNSRASAWADDVQAVVTELQTSLAESASEMVGGATANAKASAKAGKGKAKAA